MKIGVISDIHSNVKAFEACIEYMEKEGCDEYLFLGDYVSDTPYTRETMDLLYDFIKRHPCHLLRGNREEYMLDQQRVLSEGIKEKTWIYNSASGNLLYTYELLTDDDLEFFAGLPATFEYRKEGYPSIRCCHGSPENTRELLQLESDEVRGWLGRIDEEYLLCAHTHFPGESSMNGKHYFNSGCVGISIGDPGYALCMILIAAETGGRTEWHPEFLRIPYDNEQVVRDMVSGGLLDKAPWFINSNIQILLTGEDHSAEMVALASGLAEEAGESRGWPLIDEKYFEQAAGMIGIPDYRIIFSNSANISGSVQLLS